MKNLRHLLIAWQDKPSAELKLFTFQSEREALLTKRRLSKQFPEPQNLQKKSKEFNIFSLSIFELLKRRNILC